MYCPCTVKPSIVSLLTFAANKISKLRVINTGLWFKSPPASKTLRSSFLQLPRIVNLASRAVCMAVLVWSRVVVPCSKTWNNLEQFAIDRLFQGECGTAICLCSCMGVDDNVWSAA